MINGKTKLYGIFGNPIEHTLSPMIHNFLAKRMNINLAYMPFCIEEEKLEDAIVSINTFSIGGVNVTVPYKSKVMAYLDRIDQEAVNIGAVNTIVVEKKLLKGYNTDISGLFRAFSSEGISITNKEVIILGAGGVARAVAYLCGREKTTKVIFVNRTKEKALALAKEMQLFFPEFTYDVYGINEISEIPNKKYIVFQTTNLGMYPNVEDVLVEQSDFYQMVEIGYDLIYNPAKTKFRELVELYGGKSYHGLKMLLFQGIDAFELWTKQKVSEDVAEELYTQMKRELGIHE